MTSVQILDFEHTSYLNFEAEVYYPEDEGICQVEHFGVNIREDGSIVYGLRIESIDQRGKGRFNIYLCVYRYMMNRYRYHIICI